MLRYSYRAGRLIRAYEPDKDWHGISCILRKQKVFVKHFLNGTIAVHRCCAKPQIMPFWSTFFSIFTIFYLRLDCKTASSQKQSVQHSATLFVRESRKSLISVQINVVHFVKSFNMMHLMMIPIMAMFDWLCCCARKGKTCWSGEGEVMPGSTLFPTAGLQEGRGKGGKKRIRTSLRKWLQKIEEYLNTSMLR